MASVNIGQKLKDTRLQMNMSLDELQQITKIQKRYLTAIEENDFDSMPGTFYVRAFIKQYASAVNLDGEELVSHYDGKGSPKKEEAAAKYEELEESRAQMYEEEHGSSFFKSLPAILLSLFGLAIVIVVFFYMWQDQKSGQIIEPPASTVRVERSSEESESETSTETKESSTASESSTVESSEVQPAAVVFDNESGTTVNMSATNVEAPAKFTFTATTGNCWAGILINGVTYFQHTIPQGETQEVALPAGTASVTVALGASENLDMKLNGQQVTFNPNNTGIGPRNINFTIAYKQ